MSSVTLAQVDKDLTDHLAANLPTGINAARVKWQNAAFTTPTNQAWLRATLTTPEVIDRDASNCYKEYQGFFVIDIFHPKGAGSRAALNMAEEIVVSFQRVAFDYSFSINADVSIIGEEEGSPWYHVQVISTYQFGSYSGE